MAWSIRMEFAVSLDLLAGRWLIMVGRRRRLRIVRWFIVGFRWFIVGFGRLQWWELRWVQRWRRVLKRRGRWLVSDLHIDSPQNPKIKAWRSLRSRSERDSTQTFLVEGERETLRGMAHFDLVTTIVRDDRSELNLPNTVTLSDRAFDRLSLRENSDGVAAVFRIPPHDLGDLELGDTTIALVADGVEKPGNIGAMIRTADAFGAAFIGSDLGTDLYNPNVVRAAQGSLFAIPTASAPRVDVRTWARAHGSVVVTTPGADQSLWEVDLRGPTSIVIGSEHAGVDWSWMADSTGCRIPTIGEADSLNASAAAAVFLAEAARQRSV